MSDALGDLRRGGERLTGGVVPLGAPHAHDRGDGARGDEEQGATDVSAEATSEWIQAEDGWEVLCRPNYNAARVYRSLFAAEIDEIIEQARVEQAASSEAPCATPRTSPPPRHRSLCPALRLAMAFSAAPAAPAAMQVVQEGLSDRTSERSKATTMAPSPPPSPPAALSASALSSPPQRNVPSAGRGKLPLASGSMSERVATLRAEAAALEEHAAATVQARVRYRCKTRVG